jgi:hypothetical protein
MPDHPVIDAEFEVIEPGQGGQPADTATTPPERSAGAWSVLYDDIPNLMGILGGVAALIAVKMLFHR